MNNNTHKVNIPITDKQRSKQSCIYNKTIITSIIYKTKRKRYHNIITITTKKTITKQDY